jgi:hypothetical protein
MSLGWVGKLSAVSWSGRRWRATGFFREGGRAPLCPITLVTITIESVGSPNDGLRLVALTVVAT